MCVSDIPKNLSRLTQYFHSRYVFVNCAQNCEWPCLITWFIQPMCSFFKCFLKGRYQWCCCPALQLCAHVEKTDPKRRLCQCPGQYGPKPYCGRSTSYSKSNLLTSQSTGNIIYLQCWYLWNIISWNFKFSCKIYFISSTILHLTTYFF